MPCASACRVGDTSRQKRRATAQRGHRPGERGALVQEGGQWREMDGLKIHERSDQKDLHVVALTDVGKGAGMNQLGQGKKSRAAFWRLETWLKHSME